MAEEPYIPYYARLHTAEEMEYIKKAQNSEKEPWVTYDKKILTIGLFEYSVAINLAKRSYANGWKGTSDVEILRIVEGNPRNSLSVALHLAIYSHFNGWSTDNKEILMLGNEEWRVADSLAANSPTTKWTTTDVDVLMRKSGVRPEPMGPFHYMEKRDIRIFEVLYCFGNLDQGLYNICMVLKTEESKNG